MSELALSTIRLYLSNEQAPLLNKLYSGVHWSKRSELAHIWHLMIIAAIREDYPGVSAPFFTTPVIVTVGVYAKRPPDPDGCGFVAKLIIDGLRHAGVLADDTYKEVAEVRLRSGKPTLDSAAGVYIEVREAK